ncbi:MAG: tyrosine-type recombinase/integrase [Nocardioidaceae bacterium]|nr:tyrosine-type recombinase/integrase [Nocardioidaceae bacterium]
MPPSAAKAGQNLRRIACRCGPVAPRNVVGLVTQRPCWCGGCWSRHSYGRQLGPWQLERAFRTARDKVPGLPQGFRYHDLRHYLASLLIASGADVKVVQARLRHASAKTTLDTYGHLWPDADDSTRAAIGAVFAERARTSCGLFAD